MRALILFLSLLAFSVTAGPFDQTRGGNLKKRQYQTYSTVTLYVDPTGNNQTSCTSTGAGACSTLAGALAKLPRFIQNTTTINVAAGTYSGGVTITGFQIANGVTFSIAGTMSSFTVATGTNSGTTTAASAGSSAGPATITDSGQAWTVNDLRGRFITFSSGTLNGQSFPIYANTATTVTFPTAQSAGVGATYSIQTPGSIFAGGSAGHSITNISAGSLASSLSFSNIEWSRTSGGSGFTYGPTQHPSTFTNNRFIQAGTGTTFSHTGSGSATLSRSYLDSSVANAAVVVASASLGNGIVKTTVSNTVLRSTGTGTTTAFLSSSNFSATSFTGSIAEAAGTSTPVVAINFSIHSQLASMWVYCNTGTASIGISSSTIGVSTPPSSVYASSNGGTRVTGCETGLRIGGGNQWTFLSPAFDTCTTAISVVKGGRLDFVSGTPTFTGVTNEIQLDNADTYTFAFLNALPTPQVITNSYGSTVIR